MWPLACSSMADPYDRRKTTWYIPPYRSDDSLQFFKELRTDTGLYNLYLKKVRYHTPSDQVGSTGDFGSSTTWYKTLESESYDCLLQWRMVEISVLRAGTMSSVIDSLFTEEGELDSTCINVFLATYRSLASTRRVLDLIFERYLNIGNDKTGKKMKDCVKESHHRSIRSFLCLWMDRHPEDFKQPPSFSCLRHLIQFAEKHIPDSDIIQRAKHKLKIFSQQDEANNGPGICVDDVELDLSPLAEIRISGQNQKQKSPLNHPVEFIDVPESLMAEQLTYMDSMLFKKVVPHHCLGATWSRGDKKHTQAPSVYATINQFNAVSYRVIATILKQPSLHATYRAVIIEMWINIALELRMLKNFSSLKAIISALQSNVIYRLKRVWTQVNKDSMDDYNELAGIFSEENNQITARELLMREGTAKFAELDSTSTLRPNGSNSRRQSLMSSMLGTSTMKSKKSISSTSLMAAQGTVPYLGTFLTDLTMIDTAIPDFTDPGGTNLRSPGIDSSTTSHDDSLSNQSLPENCEQVGEEWINFEKKRKEFEILAQIRLLQSSASQYMLQPDVIFWEWFHGIRVYDDKESYDLSCEIEPVTASTPNLTKGHRKKSSLGFFSPRRPSPSLDNLSVSSTTLYTDDTSSNTTMDSVSESHESFVDKRSSMRHSMSMGSLGSLDVVDGPGPKTSKSWCDTSSYVIKVTMEVSECHHTNNYKCIMVKNSDHTKTVISTILEKFNLQAKPQLYAIFQLLPEGGELHIPDHANVYYALNSTVEDKLFVVRSKADLERMKGKHKNKKNRNKFSL